MRAFELRDALLWIAFHRWLGGPAQRPRPFAVVESLAFLMPSRTGGGPPSTALEERFPGTVHWRKPGERSSEVEWVCGAHVTTWERSDADDNR